jgi:hypothetical protein
MAILTALSVGMPILQAGLGYMGARQATDNQNRAIRAGWRAADQNYANAIARQNESWNNTLKVWNQRIDQHNKQIQRNQDAAYGYGGAFMGLQMKTNEKFREAAFSQQARLSKLYQVMGTGAATAGFSGKTADRMNTMDFGAFGRENATMVSNLTQSIHAQELDQVNVNRQLDNANQQSWANVSVAPIAPRRPMHPGYQAQRAQPSALPYILQGGMGAAMGAGKAGFFGDKVQNGLLGFNANAYANQSYGT